MIKHLKLPRFSPASWTDCFLKGFNVVLILGYVWALQGCRNTPQEIADTILYNGKVISVDSTFGIYSAVAIKEGKIWAVGSDEEVLTAKGENTRVIDLKDRSVVPGLIDNHAHPVPASKSELEGPLPDLKSIPDLLGWIAEETASKQDGEWIVHPKFFFSRTREKRWPTRKELDEVAPDNPVFLNGSYAGMVNTKAIDLSELEQKNHPGLLRDSRTNKLSGIIRRSAFSFLALDQSRDLSIDEKVQALQELYHKYNSVGITSITAGSGDTDDLDLMNELLQRGDLTVRVYQNILISFKPGLSVEEIKNELSGLGYHTGDGNEWVKVGALKVRMDGGILTGTAFMRQPWGEKAGKVYGFSDPAYRGELFLTAEDLIRIITAAYDKGWKFTAHITGGGGVDTMLYAMEQVNKSRPLPGRRYSIIHGNFYSTEAIQKMKSMDIYADMQPMWLYKDVDLLRNVLDADVLANFHPYGTILDAGITINGGSDHMVIIDPDKSINPYNPFLSIYTLVSRKSENGTVFHPEEALSRKDALKLYTINNAYSSFEEDAKGSIEPGKWADLVVLSDDILTCDTQEIPSIKSLLTMVGGRIVFGNEKFN